MLKSLTLLLAVVLLLVSADPVPKTKLKGVTIEANPYVILKDGVYSGLAIDLLAKIAEKANFEYELYNSPDGKYGMIVDGKINGMLGEVENGKADFAIADLTITEARKEHVAFSVPFMENQLAALVRKSDATGLTTLEDLVKKNQLAAKADPPGSQIPFVVLANGAIAHRINTTTDEIGIVIRENLDANPKSTVPSGREGWERVQAEGVAYLAVTSTAEYVSGSNCNLVALPDTREIYPVNYAFALPKADTTGRLAAFNKAIDELKADGSIAAIKAKYWPKNC